MFLSDQGRDAIIVKNIITLKHFPAIGAPTSIGQVYLGPFYYYLIAPFLLIFNFNPVGLAYGVALLSILSIILSYLIIKKEFNKLTSLIFLILVGFFSVNIEQSRFSWNPNLLPFFSFFSLYFFYQLIKTNKKKYAFFFGAFLSFSFQLHYLAFFLILPIIFFTLIHLLIVKKKSLISQFVNFLISLFSFLFFSSPLFIFDLRHQFLNSQNFLKLFNQQGLTRPQTNIIFLILSIIVLFFSYRLKKNKTNGLLILNILNVFMFLLGFSFLNVKPLPHYFGSIYLSIFLIMAFIFSLMPKILIIILLFIYITLNAKNYHFLYQKGPNQIAHSQKVAEFLADKIGNKPFNIATWPVEFTEDNYVYFLELKNLYPANRQRLEITDQMFVLCNKEPCRIINSPSWNISMFGPAKIDKIWEFEGIKIYKLIHQ